MHIITRFVHKKIQFLQLFLTELGIRAADHIKKQMKPRPGKIKKNNLDGWIGSSTHTELKLKEEEKTTQASRNETSTRVIQAEAQHRTHTQPPPNTTSQSPQCNANNRTTELLGRKHHRHHLRHYCRCCPTPTPSTKIQCAHGSFRDLAISLR